MQDSSELDKKYFIDRTVFNCPFCNRNNVPFRIKNSFNFNWSESKTCYGFIAECTYCGKNSMHLAYKDLLNGNNSAIKLEIEDIDSEIFYSVPTSFFILDNRIPHIIRELIAEAEGCLKMNYLTGASACTRKSIYELLIIEKATGDSYEDKIKTLKNLHPQVDPILFEVLAHIQNMTSDKVHEQSWKKWDNAFLRLILETLRTILYEMYVLPKIKEERINAIKKMREQVLKKNNT